MPESRKNKAEKAEKKDWAFPFSEQDWAAAPEAVRNFLISLVASHAAIEKRVEELEKKLNKNSSNSSKPSASDNIFKKSRRRTKKTKEKRSGGEKGINRKCLSPRKSKISLLKPVCVEIPGVTTPPLIIPIKSSNCLKSK